MIKFFVETKFVAMDINNYTFTISKRYTRILSQSAYAYRSYS